MFKYHIVVWLDENLKMSYSLTRFYILHLFENRPFQLASLFFAKLSIIVFYNENMSMYKDEVQVW